MNYASLAVNTAPYKDVESLEEQPENLSPLHSGASWERQEPWMAILVDELGQSFREFARESSRLARLVQPKRKCRIPSEGFNLQLAMRMEKVDTAFHTYMRRKRELLSYILATPHRRRNETPACSKPNNPPQIVMDRSAAGIR